MTAIYGGPEIHRRHRLNPSEVLERIFERNPDGVFEDHLEAFLKKVKDNDGLLEPLAAYYARNAWSDFKRRARGPRTSDPEREAEKRAEVEKNVRKIRLTIIGEIEMPNGKMVKECTGTEMKRFGGAWIRIGEAAGRKRVGDVLSEQEMRALMGKA